MNQLLYIIWNPDILAFRVFGYGVHWYGLCWLVGLSLAYLIVQWLYKDQSLTVRTVVKDGKKVEENVFEPLFFYCFVGILAGARLGHCIFYEPMRFLTSARGITEMFLPIHFLADGGWVFTGYEGLASHGGTLGLMIALWLYCRNTKVGIWKVLDAIAVATPVTACCIRLGNLMNSEIIGKITDVPWAFIFERVDQMPRHPGQLYEAMAYFFFFFVGLHFYHYYKKRLFGTGFFFGLCLTLIFVFRFFVEYVKDVQVDFENGMLLDMGQILSIPFILLGAYCMWKGYKASKR